jgi:hypothetical protein
MHRTFFLFIVIIYYFSFSFSQDKSGGYIHGLIVGDYFYKTGGDSQQYGDSLSQYSQPIPKDFQGFQLRRLHLFYDYIISENFSTRFQLEGNNKSLEPGGRQGLYVKTVYGEWKNIFPTSSLLVGLVPTPTWSSVEGTWGYRSIEKTITDFRGIGIGSDMGILLRGAISFASPINYAVMIGNGNAQKPENNKYKKYYAMVNGRPIQNISVEAYMDYEPVADNKDRITWKTFFSYQENSLMMGAEIMEQVQKKQDTLCTEYVPFGISLFSWYQVSDHWKLYGRIDYYDPNRLSSNTGFYEYFISLGFDYMPINNIHFMPNIWINTFTDKSSAGRTKNADIVPRITFFFLFN